MKDVFFSFDKSDIRPDQVPALEADVQFLREHPTVTFSIVSSCDVQGSDAYNVALGQRRVSTVHAYLAQAGVDGDRMVSATTLGKTSAYCPQAAKSCYQLNRRVHFVYVGK